ncbi:unnamed protein product [Hymenolepis diminuta]|uniref:GATA zinc finger domain-containing protein 1 n=1 Tax=Hymenolepis diminuta TaxID=6216 RepID=A0A0R3SFG6_HYMDI|nr:unnamed protein product [Hymenolepis diminuta]VUZ46308.1 unnamed protein product [Hymenolepis diminuta]
MSTGKPASLPDSQPYERVCKRKRTSKMDADFDFTGPTKKTLRTRGINRHKFFNGSTNSKSKSRRQLLKSIPLKISPPKPCIRLETRYFHRGIWYQIGDIVSLIDIEGGEYYAQIRTFIIDSHEDAHVVLTWLVPTVEATRGKFEASKYVIGMEEDVPRRIECVAFYAHCPSDYFRPVDSPYTVGSWAPPESV